MSGFRTPPQADFHAYAALVGQQGEHLGRTVQWSAGQCADTGGLDGLLLLPLLEVVPSVAQFVGGKLAQCQRGMALIADKINRTGADYLHADQLTAADLRAIYPTASSGFPDIGALPGASGLGDFTDEDVELTEPPSAEDTTSKSIHLQLTLALHSADLRAADHLFQWCTGHSLVELILRPLFGEYGRLRYLHDAYDELGDAVYTVAGTLRKGSWKLGGEWTGRTATAFDQYLFRWSMGMGGVGDAAKVAAKAYKDCYDVTIGLVWAAISEIGQLLDTGIKKLAEQFAEMIAGDAAIEAVGLGPEDPVADVVAGFWTADRLYNIYKTVRGIINAIGVIQKIFDEISDAVDTLKKDLSAVMDFIRAPELPEIPSVGSLIDDVEQRGFTFEKNGGWSPTMGVARIGLLPSA